VSPRFATYRAVPEGMLPATRVGGSAVLDARGGGFDVRTSSGLWLACAAAAGSSKVKRHETNPRARQDKTMIRIEPERRKFFLREKQVDCLSRMLAARSYPC
jgi:hypothetical protein